MWEEITIVIVYFETSSKITQNHSESTTDKIDGWTPAHNNLMLLQNDDGVLKAVKLQVRIRQYSTIIPTFSTCILSFYYEQIVNLMRFLFYSF